FPTRRSSDLGKPKPGSAGLSFLRRCFRRKKRIVNALNVLRRNPRSGVAHAHADRLAIRRGHSEPTSSCHCILGVEEQIEKNLLQPSRISFYGRNAWRQLRFDLDLRDLELMLQH